MRIAEGQQAVAGNLSHHGVGAAHALCTAATARNIASSSSDTPLAADCSSCASTFSRTSESELVLMWRRSTR